MYGCAHALAVQRCCMASRHHKLLPLRLAAWQHVDCAGNWLCNASTVQRLLWAQEYCPSGHRCSNQMFTKREYGKIEVVRAWLCFRSVCIIIPIIHATLSSSDSKRQYSNLTAMCAAAAPCSAGPGSVCLFAAADFTSAHCRIASPLTLSTCTLCLFPFLRSARGPRALACLRRRTSSRASL